jgi:uncharacterized protein YfkK (UPF0435 family)
MTIMPDLRQAVFAFLFKQQNVSTLDFEDVIYLHQMVDSEDHLSYGWLTTGTGS